MKINSTYMCLMKQKKLTVVQGNDLIEGSYNVTLDEMRLLNLALAQIDSKKPQPDTLYQLLPKDYQRVFGVNATSSHKQLRQAAENLIKKPVTLYKKDEKSGKIRIIQLAWFSRLEYFKNDEQSAVVVRFGQDVVPYLYELKESFTSLNFLSIARLDTPFAVRLYGWLIKARHLHINQNKNLQAIEVTLDLDWMREKAGLTGKYEDYRDFRQKLLQPTIDRINTQTDISVIWSPIKNGRTVQSIKFSYVHERCPEANKPIRPKLPRRPHVIAGSSREGEWARTCISLLNNYCKDLQRYDSRAKLSVNDLKKLTGWHLIIGDKTRCREIDEEINRRTKTPKQP